MKNKVKKIIGQSQLLASGEFISFATFCQERKENATERKITEYFKIFFAIS